MSVVDLRFVQAMEDLRSALKLHAKFLAEPETAMSTQGFRDVEINLANVDLGSGGLALPWGGYEVSYLRRTSTPGGMLSIVGGTGIDGPFAPGDYLKGRWGGGTLMLKLAPGSVAVGRATLRIGLQPQVSFREAAIEVPVQPTALLGSITDAGVVTFVTVAEDVVPAGAPSAVGNVGAFNIGGWRRVLVLVDGLSAAGNATSFQINPFYRLPGADAGALWFDQGGTELVSIPDSNPTGGRYRTFVLNLSQAQGWCYPGIRNLLEAARTGLGLCVVGVG